MYKNIIIIILLILVIFFQRKFSTTLDERNKYINVADEEHLNKLETQDKLNDLSNKYEVFQQGILKNINCFGDHSTDWKYCLEDLNMTYLHSYDK